MADANAHNDAHGDGHHGDPGAMHVHVVPMKILVAVAFALLCLTALTVGVAKFNLGHADFMIAMIIASVKATIVAMYFMHLRYDKPFHSLILFFSLLFAALFIGFSLLDTRAYKDDVESWEKDTGLPALPTGKKPQ